MPAPTWRTPDHRPAAAAQKPNAGAKVTLRYTARLVDGTVFDERGEGNELEAVTEDGVCQTATR